MFYPFYGDINNLLLLIKKNSAGFLSYMALDIWSQRIKIEKRGRKEGNVL